MAAASSSDDSSDIFWPGYVDAIANLAINLLFIIAVMAIVVMGVLLQMSKMHAGGGAPGESTEKMTAQQNAYSEPAPTSKEMDMTTVSTSTPSSQTTKSNTSTPVANNGSQAKLMAELDKVKEQNRELQANLNELKNAQETSAQPADAQQGSAAKALAAKSLMQAKPTDAKDQTEIQKLQERNRQLQASLTEAKSAQQVLAQQVLTQKAAAAGKSTKPGQPSPSTAKDQAKAVPDANAEQQIDDLFDAGKNDTVVARTARPAQQGENATAMNARQTGVLVRFLEGSLELSPAELSDLIRKLNTFGPIASTRWRITVVAPKGFSEALRLAYYRATAVRNALVANGAQGSAIDMLVSESTRASADNTLVSVRPQR